MRNTILLASLLLLATPVLAAAEPIRASHLDVETDPAGWVLGGYSMHAGYRSVSLPHWRFEAGTYGLAIPQAFVDMNDNNAGWSVKITRGFALQAAWYPRDNGRGGLFVGGAIAAYDEQDSLDGMSITRTRGGLQPVVGYQWFPFANSSFYVRPWAGLGIVLAKGDDVTVNGRTFEAPTFSPFATLHVGFQL